MMTPCAGLPAQLRATVDAYLPPWWSSAGLEPRAGTRTVAPTTVERYEMDGFCKCGCGRKTVLAAYTDSRRGVVKGQPMRWIRGHWNRLRTGKNNSQWRGGRAKGGSGGRYILRWCPWHPFASNNYMQEHRLVMEDHLGRFLWPWEVVHHVDGDQHNNSIDNLELFANNGEHMAHHHRKDVDIDEMRRMRAEGMSYPAIGRIVGLCHTTVSERLRGIKRIKVGVTDA